jgi:hypothetical protein
VTAGRASYDVLRQKLTVSEGITCRVPASSPAKDRFSSQDRTLSGRSAAGPVRSNGPVTVTFDGGDTLQGDQVVVDLKTQNKSFKNVRATFYVDEESALSGSPPQLLQELNP